MGPLHQGILELLAEMSEVSGHNQNIAHTLDIIDKHNKACNIMKVSRERVVEIYNALVVSSNVQKNTRYNYAVAKNFALIEEEAKAIEKALRPSAEFIEWDNQRLELCKKYSDRDEHNHPVKDNGKYVIGIHKDEFDLEMAELNAKYKKAIDQQNLKNSQDSEFLKEEVDVGNSFVPIRYEDIPDEIPARVMKPLLFIITEPAGA
jgi:hypothetical protein